MKLKIKKNIITKTVPFIGAGLFLLSTNSFAEECTPICTITGTTPEINFVDTNGPDWEIEADQGALLFDNQGGGTRGFFRIENGANQDQLVLDANGNVGIKTQSAQTDLEIEDTLPEIRLDDTSAGGLQMDIGMNQTFMHIEGNGSQDIVHIDANAPSNSLYIQPSGDIGIGTSNPDFAMHVRRSNGTAQVKITEDQFTTAVKTLFSLVCTTCTPGFRFANNAQGQVWFFRMLQNGNFSVDDPGTVIKEAEFKSGGDMLIGGTLTQGSSREIKHNIVPVDSMDILEKVEQLEIARWTYNHNDDDVVHMGPMAEDFYQAFELGDTDKGISSVDTAGVALAAIKALNSKLDNTEKSLIEKDAKIAELQKRVDNMESQVAEVQNLKEMLVNYIEQDKRTEFSHVSF